MGVSLVASANVFIMDKTFPKISNGQNVSWDVYANVYCLLGLYMYIVNIVINFNHNHRSFIRYI